MENFTTFLCMGLRKTIHIILGAVDIQVILDKLLQKDWMYDCRIGNVEGIVDWCFSFWMSSKYNRQYYSLFESH